MLLADPERFCYFLSIFACNTVKKNVNNYLASKRSIPKHLWGCHSPQKIKNILWRKKKNQSIWIRDPCNHHRILSSSCCLLMFISVLLWQPLQNVAATLSAHWPANALEVSMTTRMTSRDCEGQSELINGTMSRDGKRKTIYRSNHKLSFFVTFIPALPKKKIFFFLVFSLFTMVLLFMQACDDCFLCTGCPKGREQKCLGLFLLHRLTFHTCFTAVTLQSKSFKWNLMWN